MFWLFLILYISGVIIFPIWDAYIGTGVRWGEKTSPYRETNPPAGLMGFVWPIIAPILLMAFLSTQLTNVKKKRIQEEEARIRIKILADKEEELALAQVEAELKQINGRK